MTTTRAAGTRRLPSFGAYALLVGLCYLPLALTGPGDVVPDTKPYLTLDPGRLLRRALSLWDPGIGLGTVTHQTIGYLWPMGPYHWALDAAGVPDWLAQRLWSGSVLLAAGAGVLFLLRTFGMRDLPALAGAVPYVLTPYVIGYAGVTAILLPYAGLPWLVALVVRGLRRGGWRHPALFALVVATIGSINATALLCAGLGALAWVPFAVWSRREITPRRTVAVLARFGVLTLVTQSWWLVALVIDGAYGPAILEVTETIEATSATSLASEVVRGLGYWYFYGGDRLGAWVRAATPFQDQPWLIALGFVLPAAACLAGTLLRWSLRTYAVVLVAVGTAISVGAYPFRSPAPLGRGLRTFAESSSYGLALRNSQRAVPLVVLGFGLLLAGAVASLLRRSPRLGRVALALIVLVALAANPAVWNGTLVDPGTKRDERIPQYWLDATRWLDEHDDGTRVLEIPGSDFASYRWGTTTDPVTPGLMDRPYVSKELVPTGSPEAVDMVSALDRRLQEGIFEPDALAPMARLMGVGEILLRSDLQYERYRTPRPRATWKQFTPLPEGLAAPRTFGEPVPNRSVPRLPLEDEIDLAVPASVPEPPPIAIFGVEDRVPIVRAKPASPEVIVAGDAEGLVDLAAAGAVRGDELVRFSADLLGREEALARALEGGGPIVVTDSNRRRARRWTTVRENHGFTEPAGFVALQDDPADARTSPIPTAGDSRASISSASVGDEAKTVVEYDGIAGVAATGYGNIISYTPEHRPYNAVDGDPRTAWRVGAFTNPEGERWRLDLEQPVTTDHVTIVQPQTGQDNRFLTQVSMRLDGGSWVPFALTPASRTPAGEALRFARRDVRRVEIRLDRTNVGTRAVYDGLSAVGLAELRIAEVVAEEVVRLPRDLLADADAVEGRPLWVSVTRARTDPAVPVRSDEEPALRRRFDLPTSRAFGVEATVRLSALTPDPVLDQVLGLPGPDVGGVRANSSGRLPGDVRARASAALDGDPTTAWSPGFLEQRGHWIEVTMPEPRTIDRLDLRIVADGKHSAPTRLRITNEHGDARDVDVAPVRDRGRGGVEARPVTFAPLAAGTLRVTIVDVAEDRTQDYFSTEAIVAPVAFAELGVPGLVVSAPPQIPSTCHRGLLVVDGAAIDVRLVGTRADAEARQGLAAVPCGGEPVALGPGTHDLRAAAGDETGLDVDRVLFASGVDGRAVVATGPALPAGATASAPDLSVEAPTRSSFRITATGSRGPFWLILGQSRNRGWTGAVDGRALPPPTLVDGFANGWLIDPGTSEVVEIDLRWEPQRLVRAALWASFLGALLCLGLIAGSFLPARRRGDEGRRWVVADDIPVLAVERYDQKSRRGLASRVAAVAAFALLVVPATDAVIVAAVVLGVGLLPRRPRGPARVAVGVAAAAAVALAGLYTAALQARYGYPTGFQWPREFAVAHRLAWLGVLLLLGEALLGQRTRRRPEGDGIFGSS